MLLSSKWNYQGLISTASGAWVIITMTGEVQLISLSLLCWWISAIQYQHKTDRLTQKVNLQLPIKNKDAVLKLPRVHWHILRIRSVVSQRDHAKRAWNKSLHRPANSKVWCHSFGHGVFDTNAAATVWNSIDTTVMHPPRQHETATVVLLVAHASLDRLL